jgi:mannose-1-phosphate guanylyltransferase/mannose-6-phosphate isomerase
MARLIPVILSGGTGTRLWPLSRAARPKQFQRLSSDLTMIQETVRRLPKADAPILICNEAHRFLVAEQMQEIGVKPRAIALEPEGRNTAPAAILAALLAREIDADAVVLLLPSDHVIADVAAFHAAAEIAVAAANEGYLATFGITPTEANTGYGYIKRGSALGRIAGAYKVERFVEKPNQASAEQYLREGAYSWNSGMFVFRAQTLLDEARRVDPELSPSVERALKAAQRDRDFIRLDRAAFALAKNVAIDVAIMERTDRAAVVPAKIGWSDIGSWHALWEMGARDAEGNVARGDVLFHGSTGSLGRSEGPLVALVGVRDLVVVATPDAVLVAARDQSQDVKAIVDRLKREGRGEI